MQRATKSNREYLSRARKPVAELGTPAETKVAVEVAELKSHRKDGAFVSAGVELFVFAMCAFLRRWS